VKNLDKNLQLRRKTARTGAHKEPDRRAAGDCASTGEGKDIVPRSARRCDRLDELLGALDIDLGLAVRTIPPGKAAGT